MSHFHVEYNVIKKNSTGVTHVYITIVTKPIVRL